MLDHGRVAGTVAPHKTPSAAQEKFDAQLGVLAGRLAMSLLTFAAVVSAIRMIAFLPLPLEQSAIVPGVDAGTAPVIGVILSPNPFRASPEHGKLRRELRPDSSTKGLRTR